MTEKNPYHHFRESGLFDSTKDVVENLDEYIKQHEPEVHNRWSDSSEVMGVIRDSRWGMLERDGYHTKGSSTFAPYIAERQGLRLSVRPEMSSDQYNLEKVTITAVLGNRMNKRLGDPSTVRFLLRPDYETEIVGYK